MFRDEKLEMKVGLFIGLGIFLMFLIVFSVSDFYFFDKGYNLTAVFDYVNGIKDDAPVRLAGVHVGEVKGVDIFYDDEDMKTRVRITLWIKDGVNVERDAIARINTLGLLGEQYVELTPGTVNRFLEDGDIITGKNPINVGAQMEQMTAFAASASTIMKKLESGEGTLGKLIMDDTIYDDLELIFGRLADGEGTIGKLLVKDKVYNDIEYFVEDIKAHPWKLLHKTKTQDKRTSDRDASTSSNFR